MKTSLPLLGLLAILGFASSAQECPAKNDITWIPMLTAQEIAGLPRFVNRRVETKLPDLRQHYENERWEYWVHEQRGANRDYEPIGVVFYPLPSYPEPLPEAYASVKARNLHGTEIQMYRAAESLAFVSRKSVLMSARLERVFSREFSIHDQQGGIVESYTRYFAKCAVKVVSLGPDAIALVAAPEAKFEMPKRGDRANRYEADREKWILENPKYDAFGLIYQPGVPVGDGILELALPGDRIRHAAATLARLSGREIFVQPRVEKRELKTKSLMGSHDEMMTGLEKQLDRANVRIIELGPDTLALVQYP